MLGKTTLAEKEPSPISELPQAARASALVEGLMWLMRQWGIPLRSSFPALVDRDLKVLQLRQELAPSVVVICPVYGY